MNESIKRLQKLSELGDEAATKELVQRMVRRGYTPTAVKESRIEISIAESQGPKQLERMRETVTDITAIYERGSSEVAIENRIDVLSEGGTLLTIHGQMADDFVEMLASIIDEAKELQQRQQTTQRPWYSRVLDYLTRWIR